MTIATDSGGRQRTPTDGLSQARDAAALAVRVCTWLRDEEALDVQYRPHLIDGCLRSWWLQAGEMASRRDADDMKIVKGGDGAGRNVILHQARRKSVVA